LYYITSLFFFQFLFYFCAEPFNSPFFDQIFTTRPGRFGFLTEPARLKKDVKPNNFLKLNGSVFV